MLETGLGRLSAPQATQAERVSSTRCVARSASSHSGTKDNPEISRRAAPETIAPSASVTAERRIVHDESFCSHARTLRRVLEPIGILSARAQAVFVAPKAPDHREFSRAALRAPQLTLEAWLLTPKGLRRIASRGGSSRAHAFTCARAGLVARTAE